jgi:hypothetical protein
MCKNTLRAYLTGLPTECAQILPIVVKMYQITTHQNEVHKWNLHLYVYNDTLFCAWNVNIQIEFLES